MVIAAQASTLIIWVGLRGRDLRFRERRILALSGAAAALNPS